MRPLVEPFWRHHLGASANRARSVLEFDLGGHENLRGLGDGHRAEPERPDEIDRALEKREFSHCQSWRHGRPQSSALWVKKCLRMRCTSSVNTGSAITSSERFFPSGTS